MPVCVAHEAPKLWRKICAETSIEVSLLSKNWKFLLAGIIFQYLHGLAAHGVHYLHRPGPMLQDAGFFFLPELGVDQAYLSETLFTIIFVSFVLWTLNPFFFQSKRIYTVLIWGRVLAYLAGSQCLRIITFYSTQLPGPNYHCREKFGYTTKKIFHSVTCLIQGSKLATLPPPKSAMEVLLLNFPHGVTHGCGDLIFSSHMIFTLVFVRTYQKYGTKRCIKQLAWLLVVIQSLLIIASRKHYSVDVVVAWYTVNLFAFFIDHKLQELPDRSMFNTNSPILPLIVREKDSRNREELHRFLNGNSLDVKD